MTKITALFSITGCAAALTFALAESGYPYFAAGVALLGIGWLFIYARRMTRFAGLAFFLFGLISVAVVWAGLSFWYGLAGMILALLAWDLGAFETRLGGLLDKSEVFKMEVAHLTRLAVVVGIGLAGAIISTQLRIELSLGSALIFSLIGLWGMSVLVYRLRSRE